MQADDQEGINAFNKGWQRVKEIQAELDGKKKLCEDCEEASNELMLNDEEYVRYVVGESFYHASPEEAEEKLQSRLEEVQLECQQLEEESGKLQSELEVLKKKLYAKFGNSINLEE